MKSFHFRLDSALRWRTAQLDVEQNRASVAAARLRSIHSGIDLRRKDIAEGSTNVARGCSGDALHSLAAWVGKCNREIRDLEQHAQSAEQALAASLKSLVQANQNRKLLQKLKQSEQARWQLDTSRELEAFASEAFLRQAGQSRQLRK